MIDDPELAGLFRDEAEEHLGVLEQGLMRLETQSQDAATLEEVLREAHSLKGAARMLGLADIEMLAHALEDRLRAATKGTEPLASGGAEPLLRAVDALRSLVAEALDDIPAAGGIAELVTELRGAGEPRPPASLAPVVAEVVAVEAAPAPLAEVVESGTTPVAPDTQAAPPDAPAARILTIRVAPRKLDALMSQAGELTVTQTRIAHRLVDVNAAISAWEDIYQRQRADRWTMGLGIAADDPDAARELNSAWEQADANLRELGQDLRRLHDALTDDAARLASVAGKLDQGIREVRMLPLSTVFGQFQRLVRDLATSLGKQAEFVVEGGDTYADKQIIEEIKDPLMHLIRNAVHHGIESADERIAAGKPAVASVTVRGSMVGSSIRVEVSDDGRGLNEQSIAAKAVEMGLVNPGEVGTMSSARIWQLIFVSGMTTAQTVTDISGRGVGMDVVRANVEALKGRIEIESVPGRGTRFVITLPQTLATTRVLLVRVGGQVFGIPLEFLRLATRIDKSAVYPLDGRDAVTLLGEPVSTAHAADLLELPRRASDDGPITVVLVSDGVDRLAVIVDEAVEEQEIVLKPVGALLRRVRNVTGAGILSSGEVCLVLDAADLVRSVRSTRTVARPPLRPHRPIRTRTVLLAEDSATTRAQLKRILESAGYRVVAAVDGQDAWNLLGTNEVDAVVSDVLMPNLTGFELTERIRSSDQWAELPVVLVTTLATDDDRRRGLQAGANAYITKGSFDQSALLDSVATFIGGRRAGD